MAEHLPKIDSPAAALRWLRLLGQGLGSLAAWGLRVVPGGAPPPLAEPADTVVLMTLDGVRPRELLHGADPDLSEDRRATAMPHLMRHLLAQGGFIGSGRIRPDFRIGSPVGVSTSGYHSIFAGRPTWCLTNEDPPPRGETLVTHVQAAFPGDPCPVGLYTTWDLIVDGTKVDRTRADVARGREEAVQRAPMTADGPTDEPVFQVALKRLREAPPRLLYVGFDETDDAGHRNHYPRYLDVLERFDGYVRAFAQEIAAQQAQGRKVTLIVTTDHARGFGAEWVDHRWNIDGTARIWLFALGHGIAAQGHIRPPRQRTHFDIRPTVEHLLGLPQGRRWWRGDVLRELLEP